VSGPRQGPKSAYFVADLCPCRGRGIAAAAAEGNKRPREASESLVDRLGRKSVYSGVHLGGLSLTLLIFSKSKMSDHAYL
jgi:hypothetical protein